MTHQRDKSSFEIFHGGGRPNLEVPADQLHPSSLLLSDCPPVNVREKTDRGRECAFVSYSVSLFVLLSHICRGDSERAREPTRNLTEKKSTIFFQPPISPHRILAEAYDVFIEGVARQWDLFGGLPGD